MNTNEHQEAGEQVEYETLGNHYLQNNLITLMTYVNKVPVPSGLDVKRGDLVSQGGDYWTLAGLGLYMNLGKKDQDVFNPVTRKEAWAFRKAYENLASSNVKKSDIERIYAIEKTNYIPWAKSLNALVQQLVYSFRVKGYINKLLKDEGHFAPWSTRLYIVGHASAMRMATLSFYCKQMAAGEKIPEKYEVKLLEILKRIKLNPSLYKFEAGQNEKALLIELGHRYHALAVARDFFVKHFYSDHFAAGHLSQIGELRQELPAKFGDILGGILVNKMHDECNTFGVNVKHPYHPDDKQKFRAYGDGTYRQKENEQNRFFLRRGMTESVGNVAEVVQSGIKIPNQNYGGLPFLPDWDDNAPQLEPLVVKGRDGKIYLRGSDRIRELSPENYKKMQADPKSYGYNRLTRGRVIQEAVKRVLPCFFAPKIEQSANKKPARCAPAAPQFDENAYGGPAVCA